MVIFRSLIQKMIFREKSSSESFIRYLNSKGCTISEKAWFVAPKKVTVDITRPYLIEIGPWVTITENVTILTHGFDWSVLKKKYGLICGSSGKVTIRENCFIGVGATILKGVTIGENTIIGANSVVTRSIPANSVAAGNPCRVIMTIDEYFDKRVSAQIDEARELALSFHARFQKLPKEEDLSEYCMLFHTKSELINGEIHRSKAAYGCDGGIELASFDPPFTSYDSFLEFVFGGGLND